MTWLNQTGEQVRTHIFFSINNVHRRWLAANIPTRGIWNFGQNWKLCSFSFTHTHTTICYHAVVKMAWYEWNEFRVYTEYILMYITFSVGFLPRAYVWSLSLNCLLGDATRTRRISPMSKNMAKKILNVLSCGQPTKKKHTHTQWINENRSLYKTRIIRFSTWISMQYHIRMLIKMCWQWY